MNRKNLTLSLSALSLLLSACAVTKVEPPAPVTPAASFKETGLWQHGGRASAAAPDAWWTMFGDPVLNELQDKLVIGNENLKSAVAQVRSARAAVEASREALFPTLSVSASGTRSASPSGTTNGSVVSSSGKPQNSYSLGANASWELDLWGRLSLATTGARATLQASVFDLAAARISAQALLVQTYFSMRAAEAQAALYERSVAAYQRSLDLTQVRYQGGVAALPDVLQAQTALKSAQAQQLEADATRAQMEHAIAVLLGIPPSELSLATTHALPEAPTVPELLPATLLQRRPDIAAAQARVAAAYAQIGIADAAWFPDLTLSASAGYRSSTLSRLVSAPNLFWSLGPSLTEAIFDGGQRKLASAQARASADQATATYRQAVLTALQEVEDNLSVAEQTRRETQLQQEALQAAQRNLEIVMDQYKAGTVSYLNVTTAQAAVLSSETSLLALRNRQLAAVNTLLKNIAGRWEKA
ncbi:efflux transporter outer membrane subunit [Pelomonas sp. KK5]|uniref:efflux transporter outer membrane subunit n=1 Tax=Pelomonas sp. KK5 TaxID=1855730 RepID=UPI00097C0949|nr:efflux transporter outer membrane subunit [Pelomonas sp. KK5]